MKTQKDIDESWEMVNAYEKKLQEKEKELDALIEVYRKKALSQHDVIKNEVAVCEKCKVPSTGLDVGFGKCLNCDKEL